MVFSFPHIAGLCLAEASTFSLIDHTQYYVSLLRIITRTNMLCQCLGFVASKVVILLMVGSIGNNAVKRHSGRGLQSIPRTSN